MLQWLRENLKSLAWTLWLVIAAFILLYVPDLFSGGGLSRDAYASVGNHEVSRIEFTRAYDNQIQRLRQAAGGSFDQDLPIRLGLPVQVLESLVGDKILLDEAKTIGVRVSDAELRDYILSDPTFQDENGQFVGGEEYADRVKRFLRFGSPAAFEEYVREQLVLFKMRQVLRASLYISDEEVERRYREQVEKASIRYVRVPRTKFADQATSSQQEIEQYFAARREEFRRPEQRIVSYLQVDTNLVRAELDVDDEAVKAYYDANLDTYTQEEQVRARHVLLYVNDERSDEQAQAELEAIKGRVAGGEDFAAIAREASDDAGSKNRGGDLGFFGRGAMVPPFEQAAFGAQPGDIVGPVKSDFGYHLIEVMGRREAGVRPFDTVKSQIRVRLTNERATEEAEALSTRIGAQIKEEGISTPDGLKTLADGNPGLTFATTEAFGPRDVIAGVGRVPVFSDAAFGLEVNGMTDVLQVPRGWVVIHLDEIVAPTVPPLEEVRAEVEQALAGDKQQEALMARLNELRAEIDGGKTLDEIAEEFAIQVQDSTEFGSGQAIAGIGINAELTEGALALGEGEFGGPVEDTVGGILYEVVNRAQWTEEGFEDAKESTRSSLENDRLGQVVGAMLEERKRELDVRYSPDFLEQFEVTAGG